MEDLSVATMFQLMNNPKVSDLIKAGILKQGTKAAGNPNFSELQRFAAGIANKDYAAQTPFLWNSVYAELGMTERNIRLYGEPSNAERIFEALKADERYIGGDAGVGFKGRALELLDDVDPLASLMGAVNVVVRTKKGLKGYNTDGKGYALSLEAMLAQGGKKLRGSKVILLGAGDTGNAIAFALADQGANLLILNRKQEKAESLAQRINQHFAREVASGRGRDNLSQSILNYESDAVVAVIDDQDTPLDKYSALGIIDLTAAGQGIFQNHEDSARLLKQLPKDVVISDVMLRPHDTATIAQAKQLGFPVLDGRPMVLNQAVEAFCLVNESMLTKIGASKADVARIMTKAFVL